MAQMWQYMQLHVHIQEGGRVNYFLRILLIKWTRKSKKNNLENFFIAVFL